MNAAPIARVLGFLLLAIGIAGFVPSIAPAAPFDAQVITLDAAYRMIFGVLPVNAALDVLHIVFGVWGLLAGGRFAVAVLYCRCAMWISLALVILGAIPITSTLIGVAPIYGWNVALDAAVLIVAAYGGYGRASRPPEAKPEPIP
jgi:uncharacterized membrane protein